MDKALSSLLFFYVWQKAKGGGWSQRKSKMLEHLVQKQFALG